MKKVLLALVIATSFAACNDGTKTESTTSKDSTVVTTPATTPSADTSVKIVKDSNSVTKDTTIKTTK